MGCCLARDRSKKCIKFSIFFLSFTMEYSYCMVLPEYFSTDYLHVSVCSNAHLCIWIHSLILKCMLNHFSHLQFFTTPRTVACQSSLSMGFSRQEYWTGLPCPPPGNLPDLGTEPVASGTPALQEDSLHNEPL